MCTGNEIKKRKKIIQDFCIEETGKRWRRAKLLGIKLAFLCAEAG
jgi:hypothetical protein